MKKSPRVVVLAVLYILTSDIGHAETAYYKYVDPCIISVGPGNVVVGSSRPFGMVKPGPECSRLANNGFRADQSVPVYGFSQVRVSGTGGGPKYGNISAMPFAGEPDGIKLSSLREEENAALGYYSVRLKKWNIKTYRSYAPRLESGLLSRSILLCAH